MNEQDFINFDELYFNEYKGWGEVPATVWDMTVWDKNTDQPKVVAEADDPYELMTSLAEYGITNGAILAVRGWGAPLEEDQNPKDSIRPSLHPKRKRMVIYLHIENVNGNLTVAIHPEDEELMLMNERGVGSLADAIFKAVRKVQRKINKSLPRK